VVLQEDVAFFGFAEVLDDTVDMSVFEVRVESYLRHTIKSVLQAQYLNSCVPAKKTYDVHQEPGW